MRQIIVFMELYFSSNVGERNIALPDSLEFPGLFSNSHSNIDSIISEISTRGLYTRAGRIF